MAYINQPADLRILFATIDDRLRKLETAVRFTFPNVTCVTIGVASAAPSTIKLRRSSIPEAVEKCTLNHNFKYWER